MYEPFECQAYGGDVTYPYDVVRHDSGTAAGVVMEICLDGEYVYITKEQAMKFFNLVEA